MTKITIISGASRSGRQSIKVAHILEDYFKKEENTKVELIDVANHPIPVYEDEKELSDEESEGIEAIGKIMENSDGLVIVSPEYNGGMAGSLKNFLDFYRKEYYWKPLGAVSVSSGTLGGQNAMNQLTHFASYVNACLMPNRLLVSKVEVIDEDENDEYHKRFHKNAKRYVEDMLKFTRKLM